jgi:hypothetical protein
MRNWVSASLIALLASCSTTTNDGETVSVQPNELGITALKTDRYQDGDVDVYELRALGETGDVLGTATLRVTPDAELILPGIESRRADIHLEAGGIESDFTARANGRYELPPNQPTELQFVQLAEVSATLLRDVNVIVPSKTTTSETAYSIESCNAANFNTSPIAGQCCGEYMNGVHDVVFFPSSFTNRMSRRRKSPDGGGCRGISGSTTCSGIYNASTNPAGCYYGPNSMAIIGSTTFGTNWKFMGTDQSVSSTVGNYCYAYLYTSTGIQNACRYEEDADICPEMVFPDITGTFPANRGCCNGSSTTLQYCCGGVPSSTNSGGCLATGVSTGGSSGYWDAV